MPGRILESPRGEDGFGYDPIMLVPERGMSAAEFDLDMKNKLSHRGQALMAFREWLTGESGA
jgi:XTP/dITP diphosphohydrolase